MLRVFILLGAAVAVTATCGKPVISSISIDIVGGHDAVQGSWPWQVQVRKINDDGISFSHYCGGTLIDGQWVVSAAHCFYPYGADPPTRDIDVKEYQFVVGAHHIDGNQEQNRQIYTAEKIIMHEKFQGIRPPNDVALIKLANPVSLNDHVSLACLADTEPKESTTAYVTGWGDQQISNPSLNLQQVMVPTVSKETCRSSYGIRFDKETMMCAGYAVGGKDACSGDSGGPLVAQNVSGYWELIGIVSWGDGCANPNKYGVYADVVVFNNWIQTTIAAN